MKLSTTLIGLSMAFGTLTVAAPARPPPPTTIQSIKDCGTWDCECSYPFPSASTIELDVRDNGTTNATASNTAGIEDCIKQPREHLCWSLVDLDTRDNTTTTDPLNTTTIQPSKDCITDDCLEECYPPMACASNAGVDARDNATTNVSAPTSTATEDCVGCDCPEGAICGSTVNLDPRDNATTDISNAARDVAALDVEAKAEEKLESKGKKWDWCVLFFNPFTDCL